MKKIKYSNNDLIKIATILFDPSSIMFMYYSGSINYGLNDEMSDYDVTIVVDGFIGSVQINYPNLDLLIFGSDCYLDRFDSNKEVPLYQLVKMDDILSIDKNIIYLNPIYNNQFNEYKAMQFNLKTYLNSFIGFQDVRRLNYDVPDKSMYHILRVRGVLEHYDKTGIYEMIIEEPWYSVMLDFKKNFNNKIGSSYLPKIKEALELIIYRKRMN